MVDLDAAQRTVGANVLTAGIEGALLDGLHVVTILLEQLIEAGGAHLVVLLDLSHQTLHVDAHLLSQLLEGVGLVDVLVTGGDVTLQLLLEHLVHVQGMDAGDDVGTVLLILLQQLGVHDDEGALAGLGSDGVTGEGGVCDLILGHEALTVTVDPQAGLTESTVHDEVVHVVGQLIHDLHDDGSLACAGSPAHLDALTAHTGNGEVVDGLAILEAGVLLDHVGVLTEAAGGNDDAAGTSLDLLAVLIHSDDTDNGAVLNDQALNGGLHLEVSALLLGILGQLLGHSGSSAGAGTTAALGDDDVPGKLTIGVSAGILGSGEHTLNAGELDTNGILQPVDGGAGLEVIVTNQAGVDIVVGVEHVLTESLTGGQSDHGLALDAGTDTQGAHTHVGSTTGGVTLLENEGLQTVLSGGSSSGQTGQTGCDDDDISFHLLHDSILLKK